MYIFYILYIKKSQFLLMLLTKNTYLKVISLKKMWFNWKKSLFVICCVLISWLVIDLFSLYTDNRNILLRNYHMNGCLIIWYIVKIFFATLENCVSNWCSHSQLCLFFNISATCITKYNNVPNNLSKHRLNKLDGTKKKKVVKILMCGYVHVVHFLDWLSIKQIITFLLKLCSSRRSVSDKFEKGKQVWEGL